MHSTSSNTLYSIQYTVHHCMYVVPVPVRIHHYTVSVDSSSTLLMMIGILYHCISAVEHVYTVQWYYCYTSLVL